MVQCDSHCWRTLPPPETCSARYHSSKDSLGRRCATCCTTPETEEVAQPAWLLGFCAKQLGSLRGRVEEEHFRGCFDTDSSTDERESVSVLMVATLPNRILSLGMSTLTNTQLEPGSQFLHKSVLACHRPKVACIALRLTYNVTSGSTPKGTRNISAKLGTRNNFQSCRRMKIFRIVF
jgi:hypothetical protein